MGTQRKLPNREPAKKLLSPGQAIFIVALSVLIVLGFVVSWHVAVVALVTAAMVFWLIFVGLKVCLAIAAYNYHPPTVTADIDDPTLPTYTVFLPLYKEAKMLPKLVQSIDQLLYPKDRLQVLLLLEEDDIETRQVIDTGNLELPSYFDVVLIPSIGPRTKPKALNLGLEQATGEYCVIFDGEDRPESNQLLKAIGTFRMLADTRPDVACLQARLFFWNGKQTWVTRFYWAEYVTHFEWVLGGLARLNLIPPLGGTSNHFITSRLAEVAIAPHHLPDNASGIGGWDPWNVTEDAEAAGALAIKGYSVAMIDSTTYEAASESLPKADRQRRRWLKGYLQTGLVYTRHPLAIARAMGIGRYVTYVLLLLGTPFTLILNPFFWGLTIAYFATHSATIEGLFPLPLYYTGVLLMIGGNLLMFYQLLVACLHRQGYGSVKFMLLAPLWWLVTSWSAYAAAFEAVVAPHYWHKTSHTHNTEEEIIPEMT